MTSPPKSRIGQFNIGQAPRLRRVATTIRRTTSGGGQQWGLLQATVVSSDGGSPPTCTISLDGGTETVPDIRYMRSYTPVADDLVWVFTRDGGNPFILGALA